MSERLDQIPSVADRVQPLATGGPVVAAAFLGATGAFVLGEEAILLIADDGSERRVSVRAGAAIAVAASDNGLVTGGDDGRVILTDAAGNATVLGEDSRRRWIDQVAVGPGGAVAWAAGKRVTVRLRSGEERTLDLPSSAGGLAFAPKGLRLAIAHYNGATLWFPNAAAAPERLEWKGSHLGVTFSPDGRFLVTSMQEPMLHGWRLGDGKHMRMSGYSARVRAVAWTADGHALATSGSEQLIVWPFQGKDGPMGKTPQMFAAWEKPVTAVACHPSEAVTAVGYADGLILLVRIGSGGEVLVRKPDGGEVTTLAWNRAGTRLAFAAESETAGILRL